ncbi:hypothetical protein LCGC14_1925270 [marine sediment metagenome]|uniref:Uncharacterized protein n=1 Tax=marine sediment metagenome TaxID=412755 RepID=A0A0F9FQA1_9ZZZZ
MEIHHIRIASVKNVKVLIQLMSTHQRLMIKAWEPAPLVIKVLTTHLVKREEMLLVRNSTLGTLHKMVLTVLPDWYMKVKKDLDEVIVDAAFKNFIDYRFVEDSKAISEGKQLILMSLVRIYENVNIEDRKRKEEFMEKIKPKKKSTKRRKTTSRIIKR